MPAQKPPASPFGARLIALRKQRGLTQTQLAQALGVTQRVISYYEVRAEIPSGDIIIKIAQALSVSTDELLGTKTTPKTARTGATTEAPEARHYRRRIRQLMDLPEKDKRAVLRMLDTMTKAHQTRPA